jgi:hypothetical protein
LLSSPCLVSNLIHCILSQSVASIQRVLLAIDVELAKSQATLTDGWTALAARNWPVTCLTIWSSHISMILLPSNKWLLYLSTIV